MPWEPIIKSSPRGGVAPTLRNYEQARAAFSWEEARSELDGLPGGGDLNIAHEAIDRHAAGAPHDKTAIRWLGKDGSVRDFNFAHLRYLTNRFATALGRLGVGQGDRVYALMGCVPELYVTARGALLVKAVALALHDIPELNGFWKEGRVVPDLFVRFVSQMFFLVVSRRFARAANHFSARC